MAAQLGTRPHIQMRNEVADRTRAYRGRGRVTPFRTPP